MPILKKALASGWAAISICLLLSAPLSPAEAQAAPDPVAPTSQPYKLHVYENLVQVPTLVLSRNRGIEAVWRTEDFRISLDAGPLFTPLHMRREGDDPLSVAVFLDASGGVPTRVVNELVEALDSSAESYFMPRDRVRLFALSCNLVEGRELAPAAAGHVGAIKSSAATLLANQTLHSRAKDGPPCLSHHVWDAVAIATEQITKMPGRHLVLALTDGVDTGSQSTWKEVKDFVAASGTSVFALRWGDPHVTAVVEVPRQGGGKPIRLREDPLDLLVNGTGGVVTPVFSNELAGDTAEFFTMVRSRYVLEFQRPRNSTRGLHEITVAVPDKQALVFASGVSVALESAAVRDDPTTVPSDTSHAPTVGARHALTPP